MSLKCATCGGEANYLFNTDDLKGINECIGCHDTRCDGVFTIFAHLPRTDEEIIRMVTILSQEGDVSIQHLLGRLEELCDPDGKPETLYWLLHIDHGGSEYDFCRKCANLLSDYFNGELDEKPKSYCERSEIPDWTPSPDSVSVDGGWGIESDSARFCECCGCRLDFSPTDTFVESELEHFEEYGVKEDWWSFRIFLEAALDYSRKPDWYARVVVLAHKWVPTGPNKIKQGGE